MSKNIERTSKTCTKCLENKNIIKDFYLAANDIISVDGRLNICKVCLASIIDMEDATSLINAMRAIDRPFLRKTYDDALPKRNPFGDYMRMLATLQNRYRTYLESEFDGYREELIAKGASELNKRYSPEDAIKFKITPELVMKWGGSYSETEFFQLESFYTAMDEANNIDTPQHIEALKLICKINLAQNKALNEGKVNEFKNLNTQYNKVLETSGLRPIDKKAGGESAGIRTFSQVWEEIEKDGFIEPYPYEVTQDIVDRTILYTGNYTRKLINMQSMSEPPEDTPKVDRDDDE